MTKENAEHSITIRIHPTLFEKFKGKCDQHFINMSEAVRLLIHRWVNKEDEIMQSIFYNSNYIANDMVDGQVEGSRSTYSLARTPLQGTFKGQLFFSPNADTDKGVHVCSIVDSKFILNQRFCAMAGPAEKMTCASEDAVPLSIMLNDNKLVVEWSSTPRKTHLAASYDYNVAEGE